MPLAGELEGGQWKATGPDWSLKVYQIGISIVNKGEPVSYYWKDNPKRGFVRDELMIIARDI